ncbi:hypothetical protein BCR34DRAFT_595167 [Clohesyomyces aquaticus]|uniref:Uncharacterized protein n=1 Tax=Clohesyomyces aquaticus TaxID=1231657 RepID=A0A1Y2AB41_9PLEO|nr:hypothetical protein BCR34DRAFT_595167 [Clohesyomyces aquaticus]
MRIQHHAPVRLKPGNVKPARKNMKTKDPDQEKSWKQYLTLKCFSGGVATLTVSSLSGFIPTLYTYYQSATTVEKRVDKLEAKIVSRLDDMSRTLEAVNAKSMKADATFSDLQVEFDL